MCINAMQSHSGELSIISLRIYRAKKAVCNDCNPEICLEKNVFKSGFLLVINCESSKKNLKAF